MFVRHHIKSSSSKKTSTGRHIPATLFKARKPFNRAQETKEPPPINLPTNIERETLAVAIFSELNWKALFLLLILLPYLVRAHSPYLNRSINLNTRLMNDDVDLLPDNLSCRKKTEGYSSMGGKICPIGGINYYMKVIHPKEMLPNGHYLCLGEFYRQFLKMVNITVPDAAFFKELKRGRPSHHPMYTYYHATKDIPHIKFSSENNPARQDMLPTYQRGKLAAISTILRDLHNRNWGYIQNESGENQLVIVDFDCKGSPLTSFFDFQEIVAYQMINTIPPLDIDDIKNMRDVYLKMLPRLLPLYHLHFKLSHHLFQSIIIAGIHACNEILNNHRLETQCFDDMRMNEEFVSIIRSYKIP